MRSQTEEDLLHLIEKLGLNANQVSVRSRVHYPTVLRFMKGQRGLSPATIEQIAEGLGYVVKLVKKKRSTR